MRVVGVDGCRSGWVAAVWCPQDRNPAGGSSSLELHCFQHFDSLVAELADADVIAVDIPIGLPARVGKGGRICDQLARTVLGARQSSVFSVPARAAVMCDDYREACEVALQHSDPPRRVSKQCFHLFPKIREVDAVVRRLGQQRIHECHPEVVFAGLNDWCALDLPKKIKSRVNPAGLDLRRELLKNAGFSVDLAVRQVHWTKGLVGDDDILDACACCWGARRIALGTARKFPSAGAFDEAGLAMQIWA